VEEAEILVRIWEEAIQKNECADVNLAKKITSRRLLQVQFASSKSPCHGLRENPTISRGLEGLISLSKSGSTLAPLLNTNLRSLVLVSRAKVALNALFTLVEYRVSLVTETGALCNKWCRCSSGVRTSLNRLKGTQTALGSCSGSFFKLFLMSSTS